MSSSLTHQLSSIYWTLVIDEEDGEEVQQQSGENDCGVFAIAFALHVLLGDKLETVEFDQSQMKQHLLKCLKDRKFSPFPTKQKCGYRSRHLPFRDIELFCTCLMPETY